MNAHDYSNARSAALLCVPTLEYAAQTLRVLATKFRHAGDYAEAMACERDAVRMMTPVYVIRRPSGISDDLKVMG